MPQANESPSGGVHLHFPKELKGSASPRQLSICWDDFFLSGNAQRGSAQVSCRLHSFFARPNSQDGAEPSLLVYNPRPSLDTEQRDAVLCSSSHIIAFKHSNQQAKYGPVEERLSALSSSQLLCYVEQVGLACAYSGEVVFCLLMCCYGNAKIRWGSVMLVEVEDRAQITTGMVVNFLYASTT